VSPGLSDLKGATVSKKIVKLVVAASMLAAGLGVGIAPRAASAFTNCSNICCDPNCYGIRVCHPTSSGCLCSQFCQFNGGGGTN
jgi:hypothetical protein